MPAMQTTLATRWSTADDAEELARVHAEAWRFAYAGMLPGIALERRIASHGPAWWRALHESGRRVMVLQLGDLLAGYASLGRSRWKRLRRTGEIYELYLDPVCHGAGGGACLFRAAHEELSRRGHRRLIVWALSENDSACRFYKAQGGEVVATSFTEMGGKRFTQNGYLWA